MKRRARFALLLTALVLAVGASVVPVVGISPALAKEHVNTVQVELVAWDIRMPETLPPGPTEFVVTNNGQMIHNFEIEGQGLERVFDEVLQPGQTKTMQVDLQPGQYTVYCPVGKHAARGMKFSLTVAENAARQQQATQAPKATDSDVGDSEEEMSVAARRLGPPVATPGGDLPGDPSVALVKVTDGLVDPVGVAAPDDGSGRIFVVQRNGIVRIVDAAGKLMAQPFMDISGNVMTAFLEQGLYDIAFHPRFSENGYIYAHFAELMRNGDSMIVRYTVSPDSPNQVDLDSAKMLMQIDQPFANHNGGELEFGPDGYLYIGSGDGGWEGDPLETGQDFSDLLGSILRIDVDVPENMAYGIPDNNPFAGKSGVVQLFGIPENVFANIHTEAAPEVWNYGLRNPWQFSFDRETGDLYIADVGQNHWEEIDFEPANSDGGVNYGWDFLQASHCFPVQAEDCPNVGVLPVAEYSHENGDCAVIDIGVYRGQYKALQGIYFAGDYCSGRVWGLAQAPETTGNDAWQFEELLDTDLRITGAGAGPDGTLYVTSCQCHYGGPAPTENPPGALWRLLPADQVPEGAQTAGRAVGAPAHEGHEHGSSGGKPSGGHGDGSGQ